MTPTLPAGAALLAALLATPAPSVELDVDFGQMPDDDITRALRTRMVQHQTKTLEDGGLVLTEGAEDRIAVAVARYGDGDVNYEATVELYVDGADEPAAHRVIKCELCRDSELVAKVGEEVARLSGKLLYDDGSADDNNGENGGTTHPPPPPPSEPMPARIGPMGGIGIAALALGVGGIAGGAVLAAKPDEVRGELGNVELRRTRPTGYALLGVGSALLVTGAVLVAVDVTRRKKRRAAVAAFVSPQEVALTLSMRF